MPTPKLQLTSRTQYDTDGSTTVWNFNFSGGYLLQDHVKAYYDSPLGVRTVVTVTPAMLIGTWQLQITPAIPAGNVLTIYRATPKDSPMVDFVDRGNISEVALDTLARQSIFVAAEASDDTVTANSDVAANAASQAQASQAAAASSATSAASQATLAAASATTATTKAVEAATSAAAAADLLVTPTGIKSINGGPLAGLRNLIINGGCQVAQRAAVAITASDQYGKVDRHTGSISGGTGVSGNVEQNPNNAFDSGYAFWMSNLTYTAGTWVFRHRIEALNARRLSGKTVTVSFKVAHDFGSARTVSVSIAKPTASDNFGAVTAIGSVFVTSAIPSNISGVTLVTCQFTLGATDANNGLLLQINDASPTSVSAKNVLIGDVQLEVGSVATIFEQRPYGLELLLCQRYCELLGVIRLEGYGSAGNVFTAWKPFKVQKRASPTLAGQAVAAAINCGIGTLAADVYEVTYPVTVTTTAAFVAQVLGTVASAEL
jgi:hypothetical protein